MALQAQVCAEQAPRWYSGDGICEGKSTPRCEISSRHDAPAAQVKLLHGALQSPRSLDLPSLHPATAHNFPDGRSAAPPVGLARAGAADALPGHPGAAGQVGQRTSRALHGRRAALASLQPGSFKPACPTTQPRLAPPYAAVPASAWPARRCTRQRCRLVPGGALCRRSTWPALKPGWRGCRTRAAVHSSS